MSGSPKKIDHPSVFTDLYKSVKFVADFKEYGVKKGDVGVIVHATSKPSDLFEVEVHADEMPITVPKFGLELIKPKK